MKENIFKFNIWDLTYLINDNNIEKLLIWQVHKYTNVCKFCNFLKIIDIKYLIAKKKEINSREVLSQIC